MRESLLSVLLLVAATVAALVLPNAAEAQDPDSVRVIPPTAPLFADSVAPITPGRAFLRSLLVPGLAQTRLERPNAAALFTAAEVFSVGMLMKSLYDYRVARNYERDSVPVVFETDPVTGEVQRDPDTGEAIVVEWQAGRYSAELVRARKLHVEDWIAVLALNHLVAAIDAYVAANLWDLPVDMDVQSTNRGTALVGSFRW